MSAGDGLPPKRRAFGIHYVKNGFNGTQAYLAAGYQGSPEVAGVEAHRLLGNPKVKDWIDELLQTYRPEKLTPEMARAATLEYTEKAKEKGDMNAWGRGVEMCNRATGNYSSTLTVEERSTGDVLAGLRGHLPDEVLADLAEQHGLDPKDIGITSH